MMTKQVKLKQKAYQSSLKSRALSVLIYLIDRSNKDLNCFPAIPTMAEQLHVSISTVKRALHELVDAGFIKKEPRFREKNRGQTSNIYILVQPEDVPEPIPASDMENDVTDAQKAVGQPCEVRHITFADIAAQEAETEGITEETVDTEPQDSQDYLPIPDNNPPIRLLVEQFDRYMLWMQFIGKNTGQKVPCVSLFGAPGGARF